MLRWKIYYGDGTTFTNLQGSPDEAPAFDVQFVTQRCGDDTKRDTLQQADYFVMLESGVWVGSDIIGILDKLIHRIPFSGLLVGRWIEKDAYMGLMAKVARDQDFPGWYPEKGETR
jgi:hypothetical protein